MKNILLAKSFVRLGLVTLLPVLLLAQAPKTPFHREAYFLNSGLHDGPIGPGEEPVFAFGEVIQFPGPPWLRLRFQARRPDDI